MEVPLYIAQWLIVYVIMHVLFKRHPYVHAVRLVTLQYRQRRTLIGQQGTDFLNIT